jgi:hypothetical protein
MALLGIAKQVIKECNTDELYEIFNLVIAELNARKTQDVLKVQQQIRSKKAVENYARV